MNALNVARVHTGDPALYGAIGEQIRELEKLGIPYEVVPGVTAALAGAAMLCRELTLPGVSQTLILTRHAGKTPMPEGESRPAGTGSTSGDAGDLSQRGQAAGHRSGTDAALWRRLSGGSAASGVRAGSGR